MSLYCCQGSAEIHESEGWYPSLQGTADYLEFVMVESRLVLINGCACPLTFAGDFRLTTCLGIEDVTNWNRWPAESFPLRTSRQVRSA